MKAETEVIIGSEAEALSTVGETVNGAGAHGDGFCSALRGGSECLQGRGQALLETGAGHGGELGALAPKKA